MIKIICGFPKDNGANHGFMNPLHFDMRTFVFGNDWWNNQNLKEEFDEQIKEYPAINSLINEFNGIEKRILSILFLYLTERKIDPVHDDKTIANILDLFNTTDYDKIASIVIMSNPECTIYTNRLDLIDSFLFHDSEIDIKVYRNIGEEKEVCHDKDRAKRLREMAQDITW